MNALNSVTGVPSMLGNLLPAPSLFPCHSCFSFACTSVQTLVFDWDLSVAPSNSVEQRFLQFVQNVKMVPHVLLSELAREVCENASLSGLTFFKGFFGARN